MFFRTLRSIFPTSVRHMQTGASSTTAQSSPVTRRKVWPTDHRGEEIRTAKARRLGISTSDKKLNMVAKLVRGLTIPEAERQLVACRKKHADVMMQTIAAAVKNSEYYQLRKDRLVVNEAFVGKGKYLKRIRPWHGKGRWGVEHKKYAHLTIILRELDEELWEASVLPQYVHMRYGDPKEERVNDRDHPIHKSERISFHSQLDLSFNNTKERIEGLKALIEDSRSEKSTADTQSPPE